MMLGVGGWGAGGGRGRYACSNDVISIPCHYNWGKGTREGVDCQSTGYGEI